MGLRSLVTKSDRRRLLRYSFLPALMLWVPLWAGGRLPYAEAQAPYAIMGVRFDATTPPAVKQDYTLVVCVGQNYRLNVDPYIVMGKDNYLKAFNIYGAKVYVQPPAHGTIVPPEYQLAPGGGPAVFIYHADSIGSETLHFTAAMPKPLNVTVASGDTQTTTLISLVDGSVSFEVEDCGYSVTLVYIATFASGPMAGSFTLTAEDIKLVRQKDGTFEGDGPFEMRMPFSPPPGCIVFMSGFDSTVHAKGT